MRTRILCLTRTRASELASLVQKDAEDEYRAAVRDLADHPAEAARVLAELVHHRDRRVREWLALNATRIVGREAAALLGALSKDSDPDIRDAALEELIALDPVAARLFVPTFRRQLRGRGFHDAVKGMWGLAEIGDRDSIQAIRETGERERVAGKAFVGVHAEVVCALLEGRSEEIIEAVRAHDHGRMFALARAAATIGTPAAIDALERCAADSPDPDCRAQCSNELRRLRTKAPLRMPRQDVGFSPD